MTGTRSENPRAAAMAEDIQAVSERLTRSYERELELYSAILELAQKQQEQLAASDGIREFVALLHRKEGLIRMIDKIETEMERDKALWVNVPENQKSRWSAELNRVLDRIIALIERIMSVERENEKLLRRRKDDIEKELAVIRRSCAAVKGYAATPDAKVVSGIS